MITAVFSVCNETPLIRVLLLALSLSPLFACAPGSESTDESAAPASATNSELATDESASPETVSQLPPQAIATTPLIPESINITLADLPQPYAT